MRSWKYIPTVEFTSIDTNGNFPKDVANLIKLRGCCVVQGVVSRQQALDWKAQMISYVKRHPAVAGTPLPSTDPQIWKVHWTKPQVQARSHPDVIKCQTAMSKLYSCSEDVEVDVTSQAMYADRFRVRYPGEAGTLPAHLDNGSIERWEDEEGSKTYRAIWEGRWEQYDAWDIDHRAEAVVDLYGGPGACSVFRSLQGKSRSGGVGEILTQVGWLSLADNGPRRGTLELCPDIKLTTAYVLLRPFFDQNGKIDMDSTYFYGADPGMGQVVQDSWHPALQMNKTIISVPEAGPGDYVFWHCDVRLFRTCGHGSMLTKLQMVHKVEEAHEGTSDSSVAYIPVVPLTSYNIANLVEQRKAFLAGVPPPDMVSTGGEEEEKEHDDRGRPEDILTLEGRRIMGFAPFDVGVDEITPGQFAIRSLANEALGF
jgi:hypothetical protein